MCGINGFNWEDERLLLSMNRSIGHRGPDASGTYCDEGISMGNNRLSIIDLSESANQPMYDTDNSLVIVYNGEIYNFLELKNELEDGYDFRTQSDTEVVLAGYKKWGKDVVSKLNGMFAFAIWDKAQKELFLARDPVGIKPLFYYFDGSRFIFSSEIKGILESSVKRVLSLEMITTFLRSLYIPEPYTGIKNIFKLPPGHTASLCKNSLVLKKFYSDKSGFVGDNFDLKNVIGQAVKRQLVSDKPVGVYLSGGMDSSVILAETTSIRSNINSYSVGFALSDKNEEEKFNADFALARRTAQFFGATHHEIRIKTTDVKENLENVLGHCDALISNPTSLPMALLARFAKEKLSVVLSGDGGDELFGGYERYRLSHTIDLYSSIVPGFVRDSLAETELFSKLNTPQDVSLYERFLLQDRPDVFPVLGGNLREIFGSEQSFFAKYFKGKSQNRVESLMRADFQSWLPDQALILADQMSMSASLEQRVPLLDLGVVAFANSISTDKKVGIKSTKKILREHYKNVLPSFLFNQPKRGWFAPGAKWLREPDILPLAREILSPEYYSQTAGLFDWRTVEMWLEEHVNKKNYHLNTLWAVLTFQIWARRYKIIL